MDEENLLPDGTPVEPVPQTVDPVIGGQPSIQQETPSISKEKVEPQPTQTNNDPLSVLQNDEAMQLIAQSLQDLNLPDDQLVEAENYVAQSKAAQQAQSEDVSYLGDAVKGVVSAPLKFLENTAEAAASLVATPIDWIAEACGSDFVNNKDLDFDWVPDSIKPKTAVGRTGQSILAFALGWFSFGNHIKGMNLLGKLGATGKVASIGNSAVAGAAIDFFVDGSTESRLANVLVENDLFRNSLTEYLAAKDDDSVLEARLKNVIEGFLVGQTLDATMLCFKKMKGVISESDFVKKLFKRGSVVDEAVNELGEKAAQSTAKETVQETVEKTAKEAARDAAQAESVKKGAKEAAQAGESVADAVKKLTNDKAWDDYLVLNQRTLNPSVRPDAMAMNDDILKFFKEYSTNAVEVNRDEAYAFGLSMMGGTNNFTDTAAELAKAGREGAGSLSKGIHGIYAMAVRLSAPLHDVTSQYSSLIQEANSLKELGQAIPTELTQKIATTRDALKQLVTAETQLFAYTAEMRSYAGKLLQGIKKDVKVGLEGAKPLLTEDVVTKFVHSMSKEQLDNYILLLNTAAQAQNGLATIGKDVVDYLRHSNSKMSFAYTFSDWIKNWWYGSALSGFATQARNFISNTVQLKITRPFDIVFTDTAKGFMEAQESKLGGILDGFTTGLSKAREYRQGIADSWGKAKQAWTAVWRSGVGTFDMSGGKLDTNLFADMMRRGTRSNAVMRVLSLPTRGLAMVDDLFKHLAYGGELRAQFVDVAKNDPEIKKVLAEALKGGKDAYKVAYNNVCREWCKNQYGDVMVAMGEVARNIAGTNKQAADAARELMFQAPLNTSIAMFAKGLANVPFGWLLAPFVKTPTNVAKETFAHSPLGILRLLGKTKTPEMKAKIVGQFLNGCMMWGIAGSLYASGMITGSGPSDKEARDALKENGWQPNAIKVGNKYVGINAFEPLCAPFVLLANFFEKIHDLDPRNPAESESYIAAMANAVFSYAGDKTFLKGFADVAAAFDRESGMKKFLIDKATSFIPNIAKNMYQAFDPETKEARGWLTGIGSQTPIAAQFVPTRYSWLTGKPLNYLHGGGLGPFAPMHFTNDKENGVLDIVAKTHHAMNRPSRTVIGIDMDDKMYSDYCKLHGTIKVGGKTLMQSLDRLFHSSSWRNAAPNLAENTLSEQKEQMIQAVVRRYRKATTNEFLKRNPEIREQVVSSIREAKRLKKGLERNPEIAGPSLFGSISSF